MNSCHEEGVRDRNRAGIPWDRHVKRRKKRESRGIGSFNFSSIPVA
eukprot:gene26642-biopygen17057